MAVAPIWKDYYVALGTDESIEYRIVLSDTSAVIYTGVAFRRPGATYNIIRINDICADWLTNSLPEMSQTQFTQFDLPITFLIQKYTSSWTTVDYVSFLNDWSYDHDYNVATMGMAFPINGHLQLGQWLVFSAYNATSVVATIYTSGGSYNVTIPIAISADFNVDYNSDFAKSVRGAGSGTAVLDISGWTDAERVVIGNTTYTVVNTCSRYVLYYLNAYGGWDSLLIEGWHAESDSLTRHTREVDYDNSNVQNRFRINYVNEITKRLTLHTGWLSDDEASRMHHLLNSTNVYLYDMTEDEMIPVTIPSTSTEYKTYHGQGNRLVKYDLEVEFAHYRTRR